MRVHISEEQGIATIPYVWVSLPGIVASGECEEEHTYPCFCDNPTGNDSPNHKHWSHAHVSSLHIGWDRFLLHEGIG